MTETAELPNFEDFLKQRRLQELQLPPVVSEAETSGSGTLIHPSGIVLSAAHIVSKKHRVKILHNKKLYDAKQILRLKEDVLLLRIQAKKADFPYLDIAGSEVKIGEQLLNVSFPSPLMLGLEPKFAQTVVTSTLGLAGEKGSLQLAHDTARGASGSALVNGEGRIVAILQAMLEQNPFYADVPASVSYAIKIDSVLEKLAAHLPPMRRRKPPQREQIIEEAIRASVVVFGLNGSDEDK